MSGSRQSTNFGDWQKIRDNDRITNVFGINKAKIAYNKIAYNKNKQQFFINTEAFGVGIYLSYYTTGKFSPLLDKLRKGIESEHEEKSELLQAEDNQTKGLNWSRDLYAGGIFLYSTSSDDFEKYAFAVKVLAEFSSFPTEMVDDILLEIKNRIINIDHMNEMTKLLIEGDPKTIFEIKSAYYTAWESNIVMAWIHTLVQESRYQEAIIWCNTFSQAVEPKRIILHCLMKLKDAEEAKNKSQLEEKVSTGLDDDENTFSYLEKLFKCAWEIAKATNNSEDISLALHYLDELSGGSGLEHAYSDIKSLDEVDILIQRARTMRELREDNAQSRPARELREEIAKKDSKIAEMDAEINRLKAENARLRDAKLQSNSATPSSPRFSQSPNAFMPAVPAENGSQSDARSTTENRYFQNQN